MQRKLHAFCCLSVCGGGLHYKNKTVRPGAPGGRRGWDDTELKGDQDSENEWTVFTFVLCACPAWLAGKWQREEGVRHCLDEEEAAGPRLNVYIRASEYPGKHFGTFCYGNIRFAEGPRGVDLDNCGNKAIWVLSE